MRVGPHLLHVHQVHAGDGEREHRAATPLAAEPRGRALAVGARLDAATLACVALAADEVLDAVGILLEHRLARLHVQVHVHVHTH